MKWPAEVTIIRHGQSAYNILKERKSSDEEYAVFQKLFDQEFKLLDVEALVKKSFPSKQLQTLAEKIATKFTLDCGDHETPITDTGRSQARQVGRAIKDTISLPDTIYISPYLRTHQTFDEIAHSWPQLKDATIVEDERIREQEHGISCIYNDWRVFYVFNPQEALWYKRAGDYSYAFPGGENKLEVRDRARSFISSLIREHAGEKILVITHHLWLLSFMANIERWDREKFIKIDTEEKPVNCGVTTYQGDPSTNRLIQVQYNEKLYE